jgi:hypothetical protein
MRRQVRCALHKKYIFSRFNSCEGVASVGKMCYRFQNKLIFESSDLQYAAINVPPERSAMKSLIFVLWLMIFSGMLHSATLKAVYVDSPPKIDGHVDDPVWQQVSTVTEFIQREPNTGDPVSEKTVAFICYDKDYLYVGFICYDDPEKITAKEIGRDAPLPNEDKVVIILDTFLDRRNSYWFEINPRGSKGDALFGQNGAAMNKDWDGIWLGRSSIQAHGWETEVAIPFKSLNFHPTQTTWGFKLARDIQHKSETAYWPVANINGPDYMVSDAGDLQGLDGISQGIGLDIRPYGLLGLDQKRGKAITFGSLDANAGLDVFYQITPGLKSVLTLNTDFAQTEVDDRQINLTRFRLYFPEKRDFFLDGSNYFQFGNEGEGGHPKMVSFWSRAIGLDENGAPIPIIAGAKVTGQSGPWNIGVLDVVDQRESDNQNFAIARVSRNMGAQSAVGAIATFGNSESDAQNSVVGADIKLATSTFAGDKNLNYYLYGLKSNTEGAKGRDMAWGTEVSYPNDFFNFTTGYMQIDSNYVAGVGFVRRKNIRNSYAQIGFGPRPKKWGILQLEIGAEFDYITDFANRLLTREVEFEPIGFRFLSGEEISYEITRMYEFLDHDFDIFNGFIIPSDKYEFTRQGIRASSAERRRLWAGLDYEWGDYWTGTANQVRLDAGYKISIPVALAAEFEYNDVKLPVGAFIVKVYRINFDLLFSPRLTLKSFVQYDDESQRLGWQSRLRWIIQPGNEIIFAWNSLWSDPMERLDPHLRDFTLAQSTTRFKVNYNYRF